MNNHQLNKELKQIVKQKKDVTISKGTISGASIEVFNKRTNEDMGSFTYYDRESKRDEDYAKLEAALNE